MAAKIILGAKPKTFKPIDVAVTLPDGSDGMVPVTFKYRTKSEFGKWLDGATSKAKAEQKEGETKEFSWEKFYETNTDIAVDQLLSAIDSWGLDIPLNRESLIQLDNEIPAAVVAMLSTYGLACREGRLGN
ncbi:MAG: phage tail assembly chaperone [Azonexus sp.]